jgi:pyruvate dehydrogenase E1 component alpha subunit
MPDLSHDQLLDLYYWMRLTRELDERTLLIFKQGKVPGTVFSQLGHEAIAVGSAHALEPGDVIGPMHRDLGAFLVRGMAPGRILAQVLGRVGGPSRGRDVNTHGMGDLALGILGYVSHLPQLMPVALGAALAFQYRSQDRVALTYFGDGSASEGGAHETLNLAAVLKAPIVFVLENNQYAYSTPLEHQCTLTRLSERARAYGMPGVTIDGNDVLQVRATTAEFVARARSGEGPALIECHTLRMRGHAVHDPADYVPRQLLEEWAARDPIARLRKQLGRDGVLSSERDRAIDERIRREIDEAVRWAEESPWPDPQTLRDGVYA